MHDAFLGYLYRVGIAYSILINVILGGEVHQTFCARNWEWKRSGKYHLVPFLNFICLGMKHDHCLHSWITWYKIKNHLK